MTHQCARGWALPRSLIAGSYAHTQTLAHVPAASACVEPPRVSLSEPPSGHVIAARAADATTQCVRFSERVISGYLIHEAFLRGARELILLTDHVRITPVFSLPFVCHAGHRWAALSDTWHMASFIYFLFFFSAAWESSYFSRNKANTLRPPAVALR